MSRDVVLTVLAIAGVAAMGLRSALLRASRRLERDRARLHHLAADRERRPLTDL